MDKKRLEFSQFILFFVVFFSIMLVAFVHIGNFLLLWAGKEPMAEETIATVNIFGGALTSVALTAYSCLTAVRSCSYNKHIRKKEQ